jgi:prepilin-type N-terminal cleavage/methylation domain-containing protein
MRAKGFTLIELMVSIALFGLIASGAMMLVMSSLRMQSHSARVDVAQSALRAGLDFMTRDLLSASGGMSSGSLMINGVATNTIALAGGSNAGLNSSDVLELYLADVSYDYASVYSDTSATSTTINVDKTSPFSSNPNAILTDLTNAVFVSITSVVPPGPGQAGVLNVTAPGTLPVSGYSGLKSFVFVLRHVRYSLGQCFPNTSSSNSSYVNQSCLMMDLFDGPPANPSNPQPLAEGVEDLQVALGYDDGDGIITDNGNTSDEWYGNAAGDVLPPPPASLKAVRITIIAISTLNENVLNGSQQRPTAEDHLAAGPPDGFFRRVIRSEVSVRNFNL